MTPYSESNIFLASISDGDADDSSSSNKLVTTEFANGHTILLSYSVSTDENSNTVPAGYRFYYDWGTTDSSLQRTIYLVDAAGNILLRTGTINDIGDYTLYFGYAACTETTGFFFIQWGDDNLATTEILTTGGEAALSDSAVLWAYDGYAGETTDQFAYAGYGVPVYYTNISVYSAGFFSLIPEPSMFGLFAGTLALALAGTRRRRERKSR